jgi:HSP20 family protein
MTRMLVPWSTRFPRGLDVFRNEMDDLVGRLFGPAEGETIASFTPHMNVAESDKAYEITVDLPGMKPEEFNVEVKAGELWITGERRHESEEKGKTFHRVERSHGTFRRVISLAPDADAENVNAEYKEGVLHVTVPKTEAALPKRIEVKG